MPHWNIDHMTNQHPTIIYQLLRIDQGLSKNWLLLSSNYSDLLIGGSGGITIRFFLRHYLAICKLIDMDILVLLGFVRSCYDKIIFILYYSIIYFSF